MESARAVPPDVNTRAVVVIFVTMGLAPAASASVALLPPLQEASGADDVHAAPNVTVNSVALGKAVVPVVKLTRKPWSAHLRSHLSPPLEVRESV